MGWSDGVGEEAERGGKEGEGEGEEQKEPDEIKEKGMVEGGRGGDRKRRKRGRKGGGGAERIR